MLESVPFLGAALTTIVPVLGVIAAIVALVVAHELGHFLAAKAAGMRVEEFAVGFGPGKWTVFRRGGTEYNIRPIPAGGFVRIAGMDPAEEPVPDGFNAQSVWKRMGVIFAGPLASFLFGYLIFCSIGMTAGLPVGKPTVVSIQPGSPAEKAGLKPGDRFVEIAGKRIETGEEMMREIRSRPGQKFKVVVERDGRLVTLYPTSRVDREGSRVVGRLGFTPGAEIKRLGVMDSIRKGTEISFGMVRQLLAVVTSLGRLKQEAGGPLAIINATHDAAKRGSADLIILTAMLSLNFAVLNLLPIPVLDGGHLLLLSVEAVRRRRLSARAQQTALAVGLATLAVIIVLVLAKDISTLFLNRP